MSAVFKVNYEIIYADNVMLEIQHFGHVISGTLSVKQLNMCTLFAREVLACPVVTRRMAIASADPKRARAVNVAAGQTSHRRASFAAWTVDAIQG